MNTSNFVFVIQFLRPGATYHATGQTFQEAYDRLLHKPKKMEPFVLTIFNHRGENGVREMDIDLQDAEKTATLFNSSAKVHSETITL